MCPIKSKKKIDDSEGRISVSFVDRPYFVMIDHNHEGEKTAEN